VDKKLRLMTIGALIISVISIVGIIYMYKSQPKVAYVRVGYLYENFDYKKEMETKLDNVVQSRKTITDSLEFKLKILARKIQGEKKKDDAEISEFNDEKQGYLMKKQQFDDDNQDMSKKYTEEVMKQLNQYVQDYGTANGYTYIFGAQGSGSIMSADDKNDITTTVLDFVNEKYKGKK
jgi:outer membrane protein